MSPRDSQILSSMGLTYHMLNDTEKAIVFYHKSLAIDPQDMLTEQMLAKAMESNAFVSPFS